MSLRTRLNPLGGGNTSEDVPDLSKWRYITVNGEIILQEYLGSIFKPVLVPYEDNTYYISNATSLTDTDSPFVNKKNLKQVEMNEVPFRYGNYYFAFANDVNLTSVANINFTNVSDLQNCFYNCKKLEINVPITITSNTVHTTCHSAFSSAYKFNTPVDMSGVPAAAINHMFSHCNEFNQQVVFPQRVTGVVGCFSLCDKYNQPTNLTNIVTTNYLGFFQACSEYNQTTIIPTSENGNYVNMFQNCVNFNSPVQMPKMVYTMANMFRGCTSFNQPIDMPVANSYNSVFENCREYNQPTTIYPHINGYYQSSNIFRNCVKLNSPITLYKGISGLPYMLCDCTSFNQPIQIPNLVMNTTGMFTNCFEYNQPTTMPIFLQLASDMFANCNKFNQDVFFYPAVNILSNTFRGCTEFTSNVYIESPRVTSALNLFYGTTAEKNVYIPYTYSNGEYTITFNSFVTAGYIDSAGVSQNLHGVTVINSCKDTAIQSGWIGYETDNSIVYTNCIGPSATMTLPVTTKQKYIVPLTSTGNTYNVTAAPTKLYFNNTIIFSKPNKAGYRFANTTVCEKAEFYVTNSDSAFSYANFTPLNSVVVHSHTGSGEYWGPKKFSEPRFSNESAFINHPFRTWNTYNSPLQIPDNILYMNGFYDLYAFNRTIAIPPNLRICSIYAGMNNCVPPLQTIPDTVVSMADCYNNTKFNQNIQIPNSVVNLRHTFHWTPLNQNIQIPNSVMNLDGTFYRCASLNQPIKIPESVTSMSETFDRCAELNVQINIPSKVTNLASTFSNCAKYNFPMTIPTYVSNVSLLFQNTAMNSQITFENNGVYITDMTKFLTNSKSYNQPIDIPPNVVNLSWCFASTKFNHPVVIPQTATDLFRTFYNTPFNQDITIPSQVTNLYYTFDHDTSFNKNVYIYSSIVSTAVNLFRGTTATKNVFIPYTYSNGEYTQTFNSFVTAGYISSAGVSQNLQGVTVRDIDTI